MVKGILFDNDGTLVDTHDIILASMRFSTREVLGLHIDDDVLMRGVGTPLEAQMRGFASDEAQTQELLRVYRAHNATIHDQMIRAFPDVEEGLAALRARGLKLGVVTSKMRVLAWSGLQIVGLSGYFDCCIGAEDSARHKPEPEPILCGADALGLPVESCIYVGDAPFDLQAGRAAGCKTAAVTWGMFDRDCLCAEGPDYVCDSFGDLVGLFEG